MATPTAQSTQFYVGVKIIEAYPLEKDGKPGYGVKYPDGYVSWSPKDTFETAYLSMGLNNFSVVTKEMLDKFVGKVETTQLDEKTTISVAKTLTGVRHYEVGPYLDPNSFYYSIGSAIGEKHVRDTLWKYLNFVIQWGRFGLKSGVIEEAE